GHADGQCSIVTFAPNLGAIATEAYTIPGIRKSNPKTADPSSFDGISTRPNGRSSSFHSERCFNSTSLGGVLCEARSATSPNRTLRPDTGCKMRPDSATHSSGGTFHCSAAAAINIALADAPI